MITDRDTLALAVFISGAFEHAGLDPVMFNHRTPLSVDLLIMVGEDLLEHPRLMDAAEKNLSVLEVLRGERAPTPSPTAAIQLSWTRVQSGAGSRKDAIQAELYMTLCERLGTKPERFVTRSEQLAQLERRARASLRLALRLKRMSRRRD